MTLLPFSSCVSPIFFRKKNIMMNYKTKIKHAEVVAQQLEEQKSVEAIKAELKQEGLYDRDIIEVMISSKKILGEKYQPQIRAFLLNDQPIHGAEEFSLLDAEIIDDLVAKTSQKIALEEKQRVIKLVKAGHPPEEIFQQIDTRFLPGAKAQELITSLQEVKHQNSGSGRMMNILGGAGLIVLTGVLLVTTNRIFYVLPFIGLGMIVKGHVAPLA